MSPLMEWLNRPNRGRTPQPQMPAPAQQQQPNGLALANALRNTGLQRFPAVSSFFDRLGTMNFKNKTIRPGFQGAQPVTQGAAQPMQQGAPAPAPAQAPQSGPSPFLQYMLRGSDASPTGQAAGNNATASGINSGAESVAQGLGIATGIAGAALGAPGIGGLAMGINALGLNDLNVPGVQVNNELSTNNVAQDVAAVQSAMDNFSVGMDAMNTASAAVGDGSSSGSQSGPSGTGADGSGGNAGDPGGEGNGGTYRKGGYIPKDGDKKLEARKVTAHEGEFLIRPEATKDIGLEVLRRLNMRGGNAARR